VVTVAAVLHWLTATGSAVLAAGGPAPVWSAAWPAAA
jgi:hypothetical protein